MASNLLPQNRKGWIFQSVLLVFPFLLENSVYPLYMKITPDWLGSGLFFLTYCYISCGLVMIMHRKWCKKQNDPISFRFVFKDYKWLIALIAGIAFRHIGSLILHESQRPMLIWELQGYLKTSPLYLAAIGYAMQLIYYFFEFSLIAFIVDCSQKAIENFGANKKICWGGIFLGLTWGMNHAITKSNVTDGIYSLALSIVIGLVYCLLGKKPIYAFITVAAAYLL